MAKKPDSSILRPGTRVKAGGKDLTVLPLTLDQIIDSTDLLSELAEDAKTLTWVQILKKRRSEVYGVLAMCTGQTSEFIGSLPASEAWNIINAFLAENSSFFVDQLIPFVQANLQQPTETVSAGETLSANSGNTDTLGQPVED